MTEDKETLELTAKLFSKVLAVMADIGEVPKLGKAAREMGGYKYVRDPEVKEAVRAGMIKHKLMWVPGCTGITQEPHGPKMLHTHSTFTVTLVDVETGFTWPFPWFGEALDTSDKGFGKSGTLGFKYLWLTMLLIAADEDPDAGGGFTGDGGSGSLAGDDGAEFTGHVLPDPGAFVMPITKDHKGKTLRQIDESGNGGLFKWVLDKIDPKESQDKANLIANVQAYIGAVEPPAASGEHWTVNQDWQAFYAYASKLGLSHDDALVALGGLEHGKDYKGSKEDALKALVEFATETVPNFANHSALTDEWFKFLNSIPQAKRPSPADAAAKLGGMGEFHDTLAVAKNIVLAQVG